jgi:sec-independent protein translocase protein TatC
MPEELQPGGVTPAEPDPHSYEAVTADHALAPAQAGAPPAPPSSGNPSSDEDDDDDEGMLRMSFLEHLEELRSRLIRILAGVLVAYLVSLIFAGEMWALVSDPAVQALKEIGAATPKLAQLTPMDGFLIIYVKLPLLAAIFLASPWVLWQVWAFVAPGLYKRERNFAAPFVIASAGLFIAGGCFAYFVAFRLGLAFLLGIGLDKNVEPVVSIVEYFDLFVNVTLGIGVIFELPILIFFAIVLGLVSPKFLIENSRYAILAIVVLAAVVTPTPDAFNLTIFAVPMVLLYFVGVFAGWIFVMRRDGLPFPWKKFFLFVVLPLLVLGGGVVAVMILKMGFRAVPHWPFLIR